MEMAAPSFRIALPQVTLCAVSSTNVAATIQALDICLTQADVARALLLTDSPVKLNNPRITVVPIDRIASSRAYSDFLLTRLVDYVDTSHCLIVQWDGHMLDAARWRPEFLDYDYIGASWPQFADSHNVGNGGFSLRSRQLMRLCRASDFQPRHPEDIAIGRVNRGWLESQGMRFAPRAIADLFSAERTGDLSTSFGYHGAWLMPRVIGVKSFWNVYRSLNDRSTIRHDFAAILKQIGRGSGGWKRALRLSFDQVFNGTKWQNLRPTERD